jgi:ribosomal protein S18 acetylase RimI-like enzyme
VLEVKGLNVAAAHQRQGVGRTLLERIADAASSRGARKLRLRVLGNNPGARALYESLGYRDEGVLRGEFLLEGNYVDDHLMALDLTAEDER